LKNEGPLNDLKKYDYDFNYKISSDVDLSNKTDVAKEEERLSKNIKFKFDEMKKERLSFLEDWNSLRKKNEEFVRKIHLDQRAIEEKKQLEKLIELNFKQPNENTVNTVKDEINQQTIKEIELNLSKKEKKHEDSDILEENSIMQGNKIEEHIKPFKDDILKMINTWESRLNKV